MHVFGYDCLPHGHMEMKFTNVRVPKDNIILGAGRGFEIVQSRLGPGRIHHCMRAIGMAERALNLHLERLHDPTRQPFSRLLVSFETNLDVIVASRLEIHAARLVVLDAARSIDESGAKASWVKIAYAKAIVPVVVQKVIDRAIQVYGAKGVSQDTPLAYWYAMNRTLRIADGPDEGNFWIDS